MPSSYPGSIDNLTNPTPTSATSNPSHADQHEDANDAIEAIETELGTTPSGAAATVAARFTAAETATSDHLADATDAHDASAISFAAVGTIAGTDVQTAVAEVATDAATALSTHAAAADPHTVYLKEGDFDDINFLVGTATGHTAAEIVVGTSPAGELGGTWASPTVDATHSGSTHAATQAAAEATASGALTTHAADTTSVHGITDFATLPLGKLGYAQITADQTGIAAETDLTSLSAAVTVGTSRLVRVTARVRVRSTVATDIWALRIKEGATQLQVGTGNFSGGAGYDHLVLEQIVLTPTAAAHTYKLSMQRAVGTGSLDIEASSDAPCFILVEDIGAA